MMTRPNLPSRDQDLVTRANGRALPGAESSRKRVLKSISFGHNCSIVTQSCGKSSQNFVIWESLHVYLDRHVINPPFSRLSQV